MLRRLQIILLLFICFTNFHPIVASGDVLNNSVSKGDYTQLPEVIVRPKKYSSLHLLCYVREFSTLSSDYDTIQLLREKTIDFMIPAKRKKKGEWFKPRVLASRSAYRFANFEGLDSVSDRFTEHFSWSDWISIFSTFRLESEPSADEISLRVDLIADKEKRKMMPSVIELLESPVEDFKRFDVTYYFTDLISDAVTPENIKRFDIDIRSGQGYRKLNRVLKTKDPVSINTHAEIYVISKEYLDDSDASRWKKNPPINEENDIVIPSDVPPLPPLYADIAYRASLIDHDQIRRDAKNDPLLIGPMYNNFTNKNQNVVGKLWDKIKKMPWLRR